MGSRIYRAVRGSCTWILYTMSSNLGCGCLTVKYLVFLFNLLFLLSGLVLITVGGLAQGFFKEYVQFFNNELSTPAMAIIILGCIILVISFFGCCGANKENVCMLRTFAGLMGIILIIEWWNYSSHNEVTSPRCS